MPLLTPEYVLARSWQQAADLLAADGRRTAVLAGGQDISVAMRLGVTFPDLLVDIKDLPSSITFESTRKRLRIGALSTHRELSSNQLIAKLAPNISQAASVIGDPSVRNRGTIGGTIASASACGDLNVALISHRAQLSLWLPEGKNVLCPIADYFVRLKENSIGPHVIAEVVVSSIPVSASFMREKMNSPVLPRIVVSRVNTHIAVSSSGATPLSQEIVIGSSSDSAECWSLAVRALPDRPELAADNEYARHVLAILLRRSTGNAA